MVGPNVSDDIRSQQLVWNIQSRTPTMLRMLLGAKPMTKEQWGQVIAPTLVISGEEVVPRFTRLIYRIKFVLLLMGKRFELG